MDLHFIGSSADDWAIYLVQLFALPEPSALVWIDIVVELVEVGQCCELRSWNVGDAGEEETLDYDIAKEANGENETK